MITSLRLQQFRNYKDASYEFDSGVSIIIGPNGSGKTSLLEAVYCLYTGGSFRANDDALVGAGHEWARIDAVFSEDDTRYIKYVQQPDGTIAKTYGVNATEYRRSSAVKKLPTVLFEPKDMNILVGEPAARREFLDNVLCGLHERYAQLLKQYKRVLLQRNTLLKTHNTNDLFVWDLRLSELGGALHEFRAAYVDVLQKNINQAYKRISEKEDAITVVLEHGMTHGDYTGQLLKKLTHSHQKDLERGFTSVGPHRDDLVLGIRGNDVRTTASRGEVRSVLLALKLVQITETEHTLGTAPLILLDDVFSELDAKRRQSLATALAKYQTLITTTDADLVIEHFSNKASLLAL